ncbi:hypothetical protein OSB04_004350 [Centaurea solstitialis]|uniref:Protein ROOT INITIATION DEFECTIVE 3-like n=1 Tax=Centaurea solstitialis TaxID=347529 RepID=A0AA38WVK5_9ASTR|nr:hypothetical protein OSB04_004350 [Centaurea solstitialis]
MACKNIVVAPRLNAKTPKILVPRILKRNERSIGGLWRQESSSWGDNLGLGNRDHLLHIPTSASPFHGLTCLRNHYLVASQIQTPGSVSSGVIFTWPLSKPRGLLRSYPLEAIGPLSSSKDGIYLAGGATSGNVYIWEVINGKLLKTWHAHNSALTCLAFSDDASLLISGSEDGMIVVWPMISLLDETDSGSSHTSLSVSTDHKSFITGLLPSSNVSHSVFVSSSLDGTCKVWDLITGLFCKLTHFRNQ